MDYFRLITIYFARRVGKTMTAAVLGHPQNAEPILHLGIALAHAELAVQVF